jgi:hypothetical protein
MTTRVQAPGPPRISVVMKDGRTWPTDFADLDDARAAVNAGAWLETTHPDGGKALLKPDAGRSVLHRDAEPATPDGGLTSLARPG